MLAVQRPSMGSPKPPGRSTPFGYSFDGSTLAFPFSSPLAPAQGPSLLDDNESKFLDRFFNATTGDGMDYMGFDWQNPPSPLLTTNDFSGLGFPDMTSDRFPSTTSADVLEAATLLHQNDHNWSDTSNDLIYATDFYTEMMFGPIDADTHFGSDAGFGSDQGFIAPPGQESLETIEEKLCHVVEYLESSRRFSEQALNGHGHGEDGDDSRPRKRRKNKGMATKAPWKRKPKYIPPPSSSTTTQSPPPFKRRKSGASSATKPHRENLTEDQKRENHMKSEQKRRTRMKEGFDDLNELVPDLRGSGHVKRVVKRVVLVWAADWLEDLIEGNKVLRARLQELEEGKDNNSI